MFFLDLFTMFNRGDHFDCDLYTMTDRKKRKRGTFTMDYTNKYIRIVHAFTLLLLFT